MEDHEIKTSVVKIQRKNGKVISDCDIYIGRRCKRGGWDLPQSKWYNPFSLNKKKFTREESLKKYEAHIRSKPELMNSLEELDGKILGCWCGSGTMENPNCHGDILMKLLNEKLV